MSGQVADVIDAMFERRVQRGEVVIRHGDDGDNFYVIDTGVYSVRVQADGQEKTVSVKPVLNWANVCSPEHTSDTSTNYDSFLNWTFSSPNMVRTVHTLLHSQLACNEMQASARTRGRRAADSMMEM